VTPPERMGQLYIPGFRGAVVGKVKGLFPHNTSTGCSGRLFPARLVTRTMWEIIAEIFFFLEHARELRIIILIEEKESLTGAKHIQRQDPTNTHTPRLKTKQLSHRGGNTRATKREPPLQTTNI